MLLLMSSWVFVQNQQKFLVSRQPKRRRSMNAVLQSTPNYVASKRSAPSPASQPTPSEQTLTRPNKRLKLTTITPPSTSTEANIDACATATNSVNAVIKRVRHAGTLRRLALSKPSLSSVRPASTLSGSKIGGKSKDLKVGSIRETKVGEERLGTVQEFWIGRKGMSFGGWLKKGIAAFVDERGFVRFSFGTSWRGD